MKRRITVNLSNFLLSISDAMDLVSPLLVQHQQRVAFIVLEIGRSANLSEELIGTMFMASLLHDIGALSLEERLSIHNFEERNVERHCICGDILLQKVPWLESAAPLVRNHHKKWQEWHKSIDKPMVMASQIIFIADHLERLVNRSQYILHQNKDILKKVVSASGTLFHPQIIEMIKLPAQREEFWLDLVSPRLYSLLLHEGLSRKFEIDLPKISSLSNLFRNIIDFRSKFTATHSSGVAECAKTLSSLFGLTDTEVHLMEIAGDLHDLGKLSVPNSILEKPDRLTKEEFEVIRSHTYFTYWVLNTIKGLEQIADWAAFHHEKLDGSGYPFHCKAEDLSTGARILTIADLFTAITEDRPYRKGMNQKKSIEVIRDFAKRELIDKRIVDLLIKNYDEVYSNVTRKQKDALEFFQKELAYSDDK